MLDFIKFVLNKKKLNNITIYNKSLLFIILFLFSLLTVFFNAYLVNFLEDHNLMMSPKKIDINYDKNYKYFLITCLIVPFSEEIISRLWLKFNPKNIALSLSFLSFFLFYFVIDNNKLNSFFDNPFELIISLILTILFFIIVKYILTFYQTSISQIYFRKTYNLFICSALLFSILHLSKFNFNDFNTILIIPILLFPFFVAGLILGYLRLKLGFIYAVLFHIIQNSFFITLKLLIHR